MNRRNGVPGRTQQRGARGSSPLRLSLAILLAGGTLALVSPWHSPDELATPQQPPLTSLPTKPGATTTGAATSPAPPSSPTATRRSAPEPAPALIPKEPAVAELASATPRRLALELSVLTELAQPAPGAWVEIGHSAEGALEEHVLRRRTDAQGHLRLPLAPGSVRVSAWNETGVVGPEFLEFEHAQEAPLVLHLRAAREVAGRVFDSASGAPVPGASVSFWTFAESDRVQTAADGTFRHPRFPASSFAEQVRIEAPGHGSSVLYLEVRDDGTWKIPAATPAAEGRSGTGTPWLEVALVPELRFRGQVVDAESRPIESAVVRAEGFFHLLRNVASRDDAEAQTDGQGSFVLSGLRSDVGHALVVRAPGHAERVLELPPASGSEAAPEFDLGPIRLERQALLSGVVVDPDGHPAVDIEILLVPKEPTGDTANGSSPGATNDAAVRIAGLEYRTRTGLDGTFVFEHLSDRPYELHVLRDSESLLTQELEPVSGQGFPHLELGLPFHSLTMLGSVLGPDGPLAEARVELERFGTVAIATTDRQGRFRVAGLDGEEAYSIRISAVCPRTGRYLEGDTTAWGFESPRISLPAR